MASEFGAEFLFAWRPLKGPFTHRRDWTQLNWKFAVRVRSQIGSVRFGRGDTNAPRVFPWFVGLPFVKRFALCYRTVVCLSSPACDVGVLWPNGWVDQDATWYEVRPRPRGHCVMGTQLSQLPKKGHSPQFWPVSVVAKQLDGSRCRMDQDDRPSSSHGKGHSSPHFSARVYCGHTVAHLSNCWALVYWSTSSATDVVSRRRRRRCAGRTLWNLCFHGFASVHSTTAQASCCLSGGRTATVTAARRAAPVRPHQVISQIYQFEENYK